MQYKFRGKRIDNKEWVVGNLLQRHDSLGALSLIEVQDKETFEIEVHQVYPESVGQFTGLKDKNGKEIYEGDIINVTSVFGFHGDLMEEWAKMHELETINGIGTLFTGIVTADIRRGLMLKRLDNNYMEPIFNRKQNQFCYLDMETCRITGNIRDVNPAGGQSSVDNMLHDPNVKAAESNEQATEQELAAQDAATGADNEEGGTEG